GAHAHDQLRNYCKHRFSRSACGSRRARGMTQNVPRITVEQLVVDTPDAMHEIGMRLGRKLIAGDLIILTGPLGAGKTTLTRGIGEGLGVRGPVQSPTFVIARTHPSLVERAPLIHVDAYRLSHSDELDDLDLDFDGSVV